jgi:hypothetical protein
MSQEVRSQKSESIIDKARSRSATTGESSSSKKPAKSRAKAKAAAANAGFNKSDLPEAYSNDAQIAERQAAFEERGPMTQVTRDAWEGMIEHRRDDPENGPDPMREAVDKIRRPGRSYRVMSPRVIGRRGMRNWEVERDQEGKAIEVAGQVIASMPIDEAVRRNKRFQQASLDAVQQAREQYDEAAERLEHESGGAVQVLRRGEVLTDNDPRKKGRGGAAVIGVESFRG